MLQARGGWSVSITIGFSVHKLKAELSDAYSQFYFAVIGGDVIGYLKLNTGKSQTELKDVNAVEIERIYVVQAYHGKKVGQILYEKAMQISQEVGAEYVWLGVWEENSRAIKFYKKNGFLAFDKHTFKLGDDEQIDIMMKKSLKIIPENKWTERIYFCMTTFSCQRINSCKKRRYSTSIIAYFQKLWILYRKGSLKL